MKCPECNNGQMIKRTGKYGNFLGCSNYPDCKAIISVYPGDKFSKMICSACGWPVVSRLSREGKRYYKCTNRDCKERNDYKEAIRYEKDTTPCPACEDGLLIKRDGKYGSFLGCINFPQCTFTISMNRGDRLTKNRCQKCGYPIISKLSKRRNRYEKCSNKQCDFIEFAEQRPSDDEQQQVKATVSEE
jgi:DNA topoisomerase-1